MNKQIKTLFFTALLLWIGSAWAATETDYNDYTDIWWDANHSGAGINLIQNNNTIFASFYVYDSNGKPVWTSSDLSRMKSYQGAFTGKLWTYQSAPPASPLSPSDVKGVEIGMVTLTPSDANSMALEYTAYGVTTVRTITRYSFEKPLIAGSYVGGLANNNCVPEIPSFFALKVTQNINTDKAAFEFSMDNNIWCYLQGKLIQEGRFYRMNKADYWCQKGNVVLYETDANVTNLQFTPQGIEGEWAAKIRIDGKTCNEEAHFSSALQ